MCRSKANGGRRCSGYRKHRHSKVQVQVQKAQATVDRLQASPRTPAAVLDKATANLGAAQAKADAAYQAWLRTADGIRHLREKAADERLSQSKRADARLDAEQFAAERKADLDAAHATRNRDEALDCDLKQRGVPKDVRAKILAMDADSTYKHLYVVPSKKAKKQAEDAETTFDDTKLLAAREVNAVRDRIIADAAAQGRTITVEEAKQHPEYRAKLTEGHIEIAQSRAALDEAKARYYASPEGVKELKAELAVAKKTHAGTAAALEAIENTTAQEWSTEMQQYRKGARAALNTRIAELGLHARLGKEAATKAGDAAEYHRVQKEYEDAVAKLAPNGVDAAVDYAVKAKIRKNNAPVVEAAVNSGLAVAALEAKVKHYSAIKDAATTNKTLRVARENAIRNAILDAGGSHQDAHEAVKQYRRNRKNTDRRHGGTAQVDPSVKRGGPNGTETIWTTEAGAARMRAAAAASGKPFSVWARETMLATPQSRFVDGDLGRAQGEVEISRTGEAHRPKTYEAEGRRNVKLRVAVAPMEKAVLRSRAGSFVETRSTMNEMVLRNQDVRLVRNDRSAEYRDAKEMNGYINHPTAEKSLENMPT